MRGLGIAPAGGFRATRHVCTQDRLSIDGYVMPLCPSDWNLPPHLWVEDRVVEVIKKES